MFSANIFSGLNRPKFLFYSPFQWIIEFMTDLEKSEHKNASSTELSAVPGIEKLRDIRGIMIVTQLKSPENLIEG